ncbi:uncharacterized protein ANIA_11390 [Aspergillus nidulans FGSC A4]|uniref:Uncharacterized protein n=1 Tax=Emericella nidulans (strain FGSC A4 / ATCC 38163 / CBS 112.46 / NRRL 194 / M139) TaxID=227321 RepID=C8VHS0_EMENI|nr:hypothetical protein [Aspergillus nidulans FGSC A4]CBF82873.1 TPA: hypothetical protein ANIA_11390 [Aspergillus nidulans FGSC A4]
MASPREHRSYRWEYYISAIVVISDDSTSVADEVLQQAVDTGTAKVNGNVA